MEKAMLIPARSLTRGWKLHAKHQLWHPLLPHTWCSRGNRGEKCKYISADRAFLLRAQLFFSLPQTKVQYCQNPSCAEEQKTFHRCHLFPQSEVTQQEIRFMSALLQDSWSRRADKKVLVHHGLWAVRGTGSPGPSSLTGCHCHLLRDICGASHCQMLRASLPPSFQALLFKPHWQAQTLILNTQPWFPRSHPQGPHLLCPGRGLPLYWCLVGYRYQNPHQTIGVQDNRHQTDMVTPA